MQVEKSEIIYIFTVLDVLGNTEFVLKSHVQ